ncbi:MAG: hypothetical protein HYZ89_05235 [Candidatus Omnitrophica bacterium]|nr:hypothetical protein [Candidatus Omnitrophota bacterium]
MRIFLIVTLGVLSHLAIGRWIASPWWVPDLTLLSIVVTMARYPGQAFLPALYGGLLMMLFTVHHAVAVGLSYVGAGVLTKLLATQGDLATPFLQQVIVGVAEIGLLAVALFLNRTASLELLELSGAKVLVTVACIPFMRRLVRGAT